MHIIHKYMQIKHQNIKFRLNIKVVECDKMQASYLKAKRKNNAQQKKMLTRKSKTEPND